MRVRWDLEDPQVRAMLSKAYGPRFDNYLAKTIKNNMLHCTLTTLVIDGDLALVGMPGEIFVQFQTAIKTRSPVPTAFWSATPTAIYAYFPTIRDAAAGGYGGKTATYVEPGAGERLTDEALITLYKMTDQLHDVPRAEDFKLLEYDEVRAKRRQVAPRSCQRPDSCAADKPVLRRLQAASRSSGSSARIRFASEGLSHGSLGHARHGDRRQDGVSQHRAAGRPTPTSTNWTSGRTPRRTSRGSWRRCKWPPAPWG